MGIPCVKHMEASDSFLLARGMVSQHCLQGNIQDSGHGMNFLLGSSLPLKAVWNKEEWYKCKCFNKYVNVFINKSIINWTLLVLSTFPPPLLSCHNPCFFFLGGGGCLWPWNGSMPRSAAGSVGKHAKHSERFRHKGQPFSLVLATPSILLLRREAELWASGKQQALGLTGRRCLAWV